MFFEVLFIKTDKPESGIGNDLQFETSTIENIYINL